MAFVATQLATEAAYLVHYGARQQTRSDHFRAVLRHLGFRKWEPLDAAWLEPWLVEQALEHDSDRALLAMTCLKLHQARIVRPAIGTLERLVGGISDLATQETYRRLAPLLTDKVRQQLDALLLPEAGRNTTRHRWLVQPATVNNPAAITTALDKLRYLDGLGVANWDVSSLHPNRQKRLALLARSRSNRNLERLPVAKRYPVLVAFVRESYLTLTDEVLSMFDAFWEQGLAKARRAHDQYQQHVVAAKDTALRTLAQAVAIVLDEDQTPAGQVRPSIYAQVPREDLVLAWEAVQTMLYPTRHSHLSFLGSSQKTE